MTANTRMSVTLSVAILALALALRPPSALGADCRWNKDTEYPAKYPPLVMDVQTWTTMLPVMDGKERVVIVKEDASLVVSCPNSVLVALGKEVAEATCVGGTILDIEGVEYSMSELGCESRVKESLLKKRGPCGKGGDLSTIGFTIPGYDFYNLIDVCFDPVLESNLYSAHTIRGENIGAKDNNPDRPGFRSSSGYYTVSVNDCYTQDSQIALMDDLLGDSSVIDVNRNLYFARGHISPDADFAIEQEQDATYYYINAAPQWQSFNNGNWRNIEYDTRVLAEQRGRDIEVTTGAWNVLQLDDINNNPVDIFLGLSQAEAVLPAPDITWKVVYDPTTNEGAAIVGVNNPYLTSAPPTVCTDGTLCPQLIWLTYDTENMEIGPVYCCTVQDLAAAIPNAPQNLGDATLLTEW